MKSRFSENRNRFPNKHELSIIHTVSRRSWKYGTHSVSLSTSSRARKLRWYSFWTSFWQPLVRNGRPWLQIGLGGVEKMFGWQNFFFDPASLDHPLSSILSQGQPFVANPDKNCITSTSGLAMRYLATRYECRTFKTA